MTVENISQMKPGVAMLYGPQGSLKSSMAITWPKNIVYFDFDLGHQRAWQIDGMINSGVVDIRKMPLPERSLTTRYTKLDGYLDMWKEFTESIWSACEDPEVSTIIIDTLTNQWRLCCDAYLEEIQKVNPNRKQLLQIEYGEPNTRQRSLFDAIKTHNKWLVICMHETDEYAPILMNGRPVINDDGTQRTMQTGAKVPDGFRYSRPLSDWVFNSKLIPFEDDQGKNRVKPMIVIEKSASGIDLVGEEIDEFNFQKLEGLLRIKNRI